MKKTYINPGMEVIELKAEQMLLAGSGLTISSDTTDTVDGHELDELLLY